MTPENIIEQWAEHFNNADMKAILNLYHDHATLLPTFLPKLLESNNEIKGYFDVAFNESNFETVILAFIVPEISALLQITSPSITPSFPRTTFPEVFTDPFRTPSTLISPFD